VAVSENTISVVAALIRDNGGRVLLVRKRGTSAFMQPGGKRDAGESDVAALAREIDEELGCRVTENSARPLGVFDAPSANEPGFRVSAAVYAVEVEGAIAPRAEIEQVVWVDPQALPDLPFAPLTRDHVLPLARRHGAA
jgi:8-oxo-dGTP diphosphatase